jgi:hypothetical protein
MAKTDQASHAKTSKLDGTLANLRWRAIRPDFRARRTIQFELPEFLIFALQQRVIESDGEADETDKATLNDYVESELINLITVRDVAELEGVAPGFSAAVQAWIDEIET